MDVIAYKGKLEHTLEEYMEQPVNPRTVEYICSMMKLLEEVNEFVSDDLSVDDAREWIRHMKNADGTIGGHWTIDDTNQYNTEGFDEVEFNLAMNLMYSDYCKVAEAYGIRVPEFFADLGVSFLNDEDAVDNKMAYYYCHIVKH